MTCIVAVAKDGVVYMGGDRFTTDEARNLLAGKPVDPACGGR